MIEIGQKAPDFARPGDDGKIRETGVFGGRGQIAFCLARADTPRRTVEAQQVSAAVPGFDGEGVAVAGVSRDSMPKLAGFRARRGLGVPPWADAGSDMCQRLGVRAEQRNNRHRDMGIARTTVASGLGGAISRVWGNVGARGHGGAVLAWARSW